MLGTYGPVTREGCGAPTDRRARSDRTDLPPRRRGRCPRLRQHLRPLAEAGHLVVIVKLPFGIALTDVNAASSVIDAEDGVGYWVVAGHSLDSRFSAMAQVRAMRRDVRVASSIVGRGQAAASPVSDRPSCSAMVRRSKKHRSGRSRSGRGGRCASSARCRVRSRRRDARGPTHGDARRARNVSAWASLARAGITLSTWQRVAQGI